MAALNAMEPRGAKKDTLFKRTQAEQKLKKIISYLSSHEDFVASLLQAPIEDSLQKQADHFFTQDLLRSWQKEERKLIQTNCGDHPLPNEHCGFGYDPFFCAQDIPNTPFLHEETNPEDLSLLYSLSWTAKGKPVSSYKLIKENGVWKVDGVLCQTGSAFHFTTIPHEEVISVEK